MKNHQQTTGRRNLNIRFDTGRRFLNDYKVQKGFRPSFGQLLNSYLGGVTDEHYQANNPGVFDATASGLAFLVRDSLHKARNNHLLNQLDAEQIHPLWQAAAYMDFFLDNNSFSSYNRLEVLGERNETARSEWGEEAKNVIEDITPALVDDILGGNPESVLSDEKAISISDLCYDAARVLQGIAFLKIAKDGFKPDGLWYHQKSIIADGSLGDDRKKTINDYPTYGDHIGILIVGGHDAFLSDLENMIGDTTWGHIDFYQETSGHLSSCVFDYMLDLKQIATRSLRSFCSRQSLKQDNYKLN